VQDISLKTLTPIAAPTSTTRPMADLISKFTNRLEDKPGDFRRKLLSESLAPAGAERETLEARRAELIRSLRPEPGPDADDVIYGILAGGNTFGMSEREVSVKVRIYAEALQKHPTWAIEQARRTFAKGGWKCSWDGNGVPSSASVNAECSFITLEIEAEVNRIAQVLDAEIVDSETTADERKANVASIAKLLAELRNGEPANERAMREVREERAAQLETQRKAAKAGAE
jgi:hypothetical protein